MKQNPLVGKDCEFACNHYYDMSARQIAEELKCSISKVTNTWAKYGLKGKTKRIYPINNQDYFSTINTPSKAYFLGFIAADGCVYKRKKYNQQGVLRLQIIKEDEAILQILKNELGTDIPLHYHSGKYVSLEICCEQIYQDLNELGLHERKTYENAIPNGIPNDLFKYFIRGYFDGDGTISTNTTLNPNQVNIAISGYENNLQKIINYLKAQNIITTFSSDKRKMSLGYGAFGSLTVPNIISKYSFLRLIYDDETVPYLERKRSLAMHFTKIIEEDNSPMKVIARIYYKKAVLNERNIINKIQPVFDFEEVEHLNDKDRGGIGSTGVK